MREFEGKTAVVTGAASGIGFGLAERFASLGMHVVLADVERDELERATGELEKQGRSVLGVVTDTRSRGSVEALAERWGVGLFCVGHEHVETGIEIRADRVIVLNSDHERATALPLDLADLPTPEDALLWAMPLACVETWEAAQCSVDSRS